MGPTWVLSAPNRLHVGPINLAIRVVLFMQMYVGVHFYRTVLGLVDHEFTLYINRDNISMQIRGWLVNVADGCIYGYLVSE